MYSNYLQLFLHFYILERKNARFLWKFFPQFSMKESYNNYHIHHILPVTGNNY